MELTRCANKRDPDCDGFSDGGFVETRNTVIIERDGVTAALCVSCLVKLSDIAGAATVHLERVSSGS